MADGERQTDCEANNIEGNSKEGVEEAGSRNSGIKPNFGISTNINLEAKIRSYEA